ncbi:glycosyltransferase, partial [Cutibacterium acnes]
MNRPLLTAVVAAFNEADSLPLLHPRIVAALEAAEREHGIEARVLYVDDGSRDRTWEVLCGLAGADPRVALLFLIPGSGTTFRVNGRAVISADPDLLASLAVDGQAPRTAIVITVERAYFQCARAVVRSKIWDPATHVDPASLPTAGEILAALTDGEVG